MARNQLIQEIGELIGMGAAIQLTRRYGGRSLSVPRPDNLGESHPLIFAVGKASARALAEQWGGQSLILPQEVNALLDLRNQEIARRFVHNNESIRSLSFEFGLDRKRIQTILDAAGYQDLRLSRSVTEA